MIICKVCGNPAKYQYVKLAGQNICMDCAVTRTIDDMMAELGLEYEDVPEELEVEYTINDESGEVVPADVGDGPRCEGMTSPDDCKNCPNNCYGDSEPIVSQT